MCQMNDKTHALDNIFKLYECKLLHRKQGFATGKKMWVEEENTYRDEIIYVCKEGCPSNEQ